MNDPTKRPDSAQVTPQADAGRYATVNGLHLYYEIHGTGRPLVLLHGSYMTIDLNWSRLLPE